MKKNIFFSLAIMLMLLLTIAYPIGTVQADNPVSVTINVLDSHNNPISGATARWNTGSWHYVTGSTDTNGQLTFDVDEPYNSIFVDYHQTTASLTMAEVQAAGNSPSFQTVDARIRLIDCAGDGLAGGIAQQGKGSWISMGTTQADGYLNPDWEVFAGGPYQYKMEVNHSSQIKYMSVDGLADNVFQTGSINFGSQTAHWAHGSHYYFTGLIQLLPGTYHMDIGGVGFDFTIIAGVCGITPPYGGTNQDPDLGVDQPNVSVDEGQTASNSGSVSDPDGDTVTLSASVGTVNNDDDGTWSWSFGTIDGPADSQTVTITADDSKGGVSQKTFDLTVNNVPPTAVSLYPTIPEPVVTVNTSITFDATFTDPAGTTDEDYTCNFDWDGDGAVDDTTTGPYVSCNTVASYSTPGVYVVKFMVTDKDSGVSNELEYRYVVVYDPSGGFVTGGGWFISPEGAYTADETLSGKATFGFVAKYKKGATVPDGNTEFQFKAGDLNFHSSNYDWLVVTGSDYARFKGTGTINGEGSYKFMIWAGDSAGSSGEDTFRIKIWTGDEDSPVYDNGMDQPISGGSIVVHN
jgi:hypothetical protein